MAAGRRARREAAARRIGWGLAACLGALLFVPEAAALAVAVPEFSLEAIGRWAQALATSPASAWASLAEGLPRWLDAPAGLEGTRLPLALTLLAVPALFTAAALLRSGEAREGETA